MLRGDVVVIAVLVVRFVGIGSVVVATTATTSTHVSTAAATVVAVSTSAVDVVTIWSVTVDVITINFTTLVVFNRYNLLPLRYLLQERMIQNFHNISPFHWIQMYKTLHEIQSFTR
jgi:hypothetical protein